MREFVSLDQAAQSLESGNALILDTDTVAGIAISAKRPDALHLLYDAKRRDESKPISWLVGSLEDLARYGCEIPEYAFELAKAYWPGALTLVVRASENADPRLVAKDGTVGLRMPNDASCIELIRRIRSPLVTTSANFSGDSAPRSVSYIDDDFADGVLALAPCEPLPQKGFPDACLASTVIDCTDERPCLKRSGAIPFSDIIEVVRESKSFESPKHESIGEAPCA